MSKLLILGICGKARSGKDTVARHLVSEHGFFRIGLADGMRSAFSDIDGPTWELRKELESANKTNRWVAQTMGTECRNDICQRSHWVNHTLTKIRYLTEYHPIPRFRFVVPDIRFQHEVGGLKAWAEVWGGNFVCWKLERPGSGLEGDAGKHASETSVDSITVDTIIANDSTAIDLRATASWEFGRLWDEMGGES